METAEGHREEAGQQGEPRPPSNVLASRGEEAHARSGSDDAHVVDGGAENRNPCQEEEEEEEEGGGEEAHFPRPDPEQRDMSARRSSTWEPLGRHRTGNIARRKPMIEHAAAPAGRLAPAAARRPRSLEPAILHRGSLVYKKKEHWAVLSSAELVVYSWRKEAGRLIRGEAVVRIEASSILDVSERKKSVGFDLVTQDERGTLAGTEKTAFAKKVAERVARNDVQRYETKSRRFSPPSLAERERWMELLREIVEENERLRPLKCVVIVYRERTKKTEKCGQDAASALYGHSVCEQHQIVTSQDRSRLYLLNRPLNVIGDLVNLTLSHVGFPSYQVSHWALLYINNQCPTLHELHIDGRGCVVYQRQVVELTALEPMGFQKFKSALWRTEVKKCFYEEMVGIFENHHLNNQPYTIRGNNCQTYVLHVLDELYQKGHFENKLYANKLTVS